MTPEEQIRLIEDSIRESLDNFIGTPLTGDVERAIGETVKDQLKKLLPDLDPPIKITIQGNIAEISFPYEEGMFQFQILPRNIKS